MRRLFRRKLGAAGIFLNPESARHYLQKVDRLTGNCYKAELTQILVQVPTKEQLITASECLACVRE